MSRPADKERPVAASPVDAPPGAGSTAVALLPSHLPSREGAISIGALWRFYAPLGATQSLMTVSHAIINGSLNRTTHPELSLASYAISQSLHMLFESPMVMLRQTGAALLRDRAGWPAYLRVAIVACALNVLLSFLVAWTPLGRVVFQHLFGTTDELLPVVINTFRFSMFIVMFSTMRCVLQSVLLVKRKTLWITLGMAIRLAVMFALAVMFTQTGWLQDGRRGALIFLAGMVTEAFSGLVSFRKWFRTLPEKSQTAAHHSPLTTHRVTAFYLPLVLAAMTSALAPSVIYASLARMAEPRTVIATFAQASVVTNLIIGCLFMVHQVSLFFASPAGTPGAHERNRVVHRFCIQLATGTCAILGVFAWTPLGDWLLLRVFQTTPGLLPAVKDVLRVSMFLPLIAVWNEYRVGLLLAVGQSRVLTITKLCSISSLAIVVFSLAWLFPHLGAVASPIGSLCALSVEQSVLLWMTTRLRRN